MLNKLPLGVIASGVLLLSAHGRAQQAADKTDGLRFTVSKETTAIVSPLKADGSPDYLRALNERFGKDVTAENNGFALTLQIMGTGSDQVSDNVREPFLKLLGIQAVPAGTEAWESFDAYDRRTRQLDETAASDQFAALHLRLWKAEEVPVVAAYLKKEEAMLARGAEAVARPRWWIPSVSSGGTMVGAMLPSLGSIRGMANAWAAGATLRAQAGNFDGFLADVRSIKLLGVQLSHGPTLIEALVGVAISAMGDQTIGAVAASGTLSEEQCARARKMLAEIPALGKLDVILDCSERWWQLDLVQCFSRPANVEALRKSFKTDLSVLGLDSENMGPLATIDVDRVDWDVPLKQINERMNKMVALIKLASLKEYLLANDALEAELATWKKEESAAGGDKALAWKEGETKEAYSERVGRALMAEFFPSLGRVEILQRRGVMEQQMADALLAAAAARAHDGKWPDKLDLLVPARIQAVPRDIHAEGIGDGAVRYRLTPGGPRIYSIGDDGKDDGGIRDYERKLDDIGIGAEPK